MKHLVSKAGRTEKVEFLGDKLDVRVLSLRDLKKFQALAKKLSDEEDSGDFETQLKLQNEFIRATVVGAEEMTDEELESFAPADLEGLMKKAFEINGIAMNAEDKDDKGNPDA